MTSTDILSRAERFIWLHARLLERRVFERLFLGSSADVVADALRAYRNPDCGFGHALEPDLRAPSSQPLFVDFALTTLLEAEANDEPLVEGACEFLACVARDDGAVPYVLPNALEHPRAGHWNGAYALDPAQNATTGITGRLHALGARHEWVSRATEWCFERISGQPKYTGHGILNALSFLEHAPDRERADALWPGVARRLFESDYVLMDIPAATYGLSPLRFAPTPTCAARQLFSDSDIVRHLDALVADQQEDGGWPITWDAPRGAAHAEWRGKWTLDAVRTLRAYGRV